MKKTKLKYMIDARKIAILRDTRSRWPVNIIGDGSKWLCQGCGVSNKQALYVKHKADCQYVEHYKAIDALTAALEGRGK
jgi:hypothetical protein